MSIQPIIETRNLTIGYRQKHSQTMVQTGLNLTVYPSEMICLIGPNGCGKSTLLRSIGGLQPLLGGDIRINQIPIQKQTLSAKAKLISLVLTDKIEVSHLSIADLIAMGRNPYTDWLGKLNEQDKQLIDTAIRQVHLEGYENRYLNELSDGERQRALIAKALTQDTPVILLDEPTAHLDLPNRVDIMLLLRKLAKDTGKAILMSTHELDLALQTSDRIWLMSPRQGGLQTGLPDELIKSNSIQNVFATHSFSFTGEGGSIRVKLDGNR